MTPPHRIAAIPGDGIGREVMPEGLRVLAAATRRFDIALDITPIDWASCDWYQQHGQMMPDDWKAQIGGMDAILFGAVGWPATVPDHISLWGSLLKFRREFDQYINLRPARLFEGVPCPLAGRKPGDIDMLIVRENTEGEYSSVGGVMFGGTAREFVLQESVFTRHGSERLLNYAFNLARSRARKHVTVATKSNGIAISMPWWDERAAEAAARELLSLKRRPEAIFVANDHMAVAVMDVARYEFGLSIPDDLSIAGYDDVGPARWPSYGITSVTQPIEGMVEATVDILMDQIASGEIEAHHKVIAGEMVVRTSARLPKTGIVTVDGRLLYRPEGKP